MPPTETKLVVQWGDAIGRVVGLAGADGENVCDFEDAETVWIEVETGDYIGQCFGLPIGEVTITLNTLH